MNYSFHFPPQTNDDITRVDRVLMATNAGIRTHRECMPGGNKALDWIAGAWIGEQVTVAALESSIGVGSVGE